MKNCVVIYNPNSGNTVTDENIKIRDGILSDIAPTLLDLMGVEIPEDMTSKSIIVK